VDQQPHQSTAQHHPVTVVVRLIIIDLFAIIVAGPGGRWSTVVVDIAAVVTTGFVSFEPVKNNECGGSGVSTSCNQKNS
jgi:hypothetical protein